MLTNKLLHKWSNLPGLTTKALYPDLLILNIVSSGDFDSSNSSRNTDPQPSHVLEALSEMLGHDLRLTDLG